MRRLLIFRRVSGASMAPLLRGNDIVVGTGLYRKLRVGDVVIIRHNGLEKIKRVTDIRGDSIYVKGDNPSASTDSRHFGWVANSLVVGRVFGPHHIRRIRQREV